MSKDVADKLLTETAKPRPGRGAPGGQRCSSPTSAPTPASPRARGRAPDRGDAQRVLHLHGGRRSSTTSGILDKFIGDAIMAVFGAPFSRPEIDPVNAVSTALDMDAALARYNEERAAAGPAAHRHRHRHLRGRGGLRQHRLREAHGLHGHRGRGQPGLALEGATKQYGARIMISEFTQASVGQRFVMRELDRIRVKGKSGPVRDLRGAGRAGRAAARGDGAAARAHERGDGRSIASAAWREALRRVRAAGRTPARGRGVRAVRRSAAGYFLEHLPETTGTACGT